VGSLLVGVGAPRVKVMTPQGPSSQSAYPSPGAEASVSSVGGRQGAGRGHASGRGGWLPTMGTGTPVDARADVVTAMLVWLRATASASSPT
jgi:hypothetical protein